MATEKYVTESAMKVLLQNIKDYHDNDTIDIESMTLKLPMNRSGFRG